MCNVENMLEYVWSRMFLTSIGFLKSICVNKSKYGWISLEYAWICLKYNVRYTPKVR